MCDLFVREAIGTILLVSRIKPIEMWHTCSKTLQNDSSAMEKETVFEPTKDKVRVEDRKGAGGE
jgi:phage/plasmid primase-like uncharacterized protein